MLALLFPGQGSQVVGMGRDVAETSQAARRVFDAADAALGSLLPERLSKLCFEGPEEKLRPTEIQQPAVLATSIALLRALEEGGALQQVAPQKFREHFGADAVLYIEIKEWVTSYLVIASSVTVAMDYRLVHTDTGDVLWSESAKHTVSSDSGGGGGILASMINAAITASFTEYVAIARVANQRGLESLPPGPYHAAFEETKQAHLEASRRAREREGKE